MFISGGNTYYSLDYKDILLGNDSKGHNTAGVAGVQLEFQARSWALTHYILSSTDNIQRFRNYNKLVAQAIEQRLSVSTSWVCIPVQTLLFLFRIAVNLLSLFLLKCLIECFILLLLLACLQLSFTIVNLSIAI